MSHGRPSVVAQSPEGYPSLGGSIFQDCLRLAQLVERCQAWVQDHISCRRQRVFLWETSPEAPSNPLLDVFRQEGIALHEAQYFDSLTWRRYCPRADHGHVMMGPLVSQGGTLGAIALTRAQEDPAFSSLELARLNRLCLLFSTRWAEIKAGCQQNWPDHLTPREREVCQAVCGGLRNAQIAAHLQISQHTVKQHLKTSYRKLGVSSRTELLQKLLQMPAIM